MPVQIRLFAFDDYDTYHSWFADERLNRALGPIDRDWLDCALHDEGYVVLAAVRENVLIGVIGIEVPGTTEETNYVITDLAIRPASRHQGVGSELLNLLINHSRLSALRDWTCYVAYRNHAAIRFFEKNNWSLTEESDMIRFTFQRTDPPEKQVFGTEC